MSKQRYGTKAIAIALFLITTFFSFNIASAAVPFGSQKPAETGFGGDTEAATDKWIEGSVRQVNGALVIQNNSARVDLNPDDYGGKDGFIWQTMLAATKNGKELTYEEISRLVESILEKYFLNIDNLQIILRQLQSWGITDRDELMTLLIKY
ncbi:MAG: hypothetical protein WCX69_01735 [Candidatus Paceibacterota bacterium]